MNENHLDDKLNIPHMVMTFVLAAVMYTILLAVCRIVPFGENTWLALDMKRRYVDYYAYFKTILSGDNNIFYSFSTALGSGITGFYANYLTSPLLLITALFPVSQMPVAISVIIGLKLSLAAMTCDCMLQKVCGKGAYICTLSYAFCVYMIFNAMNIMWLDVFIVLPVVIIMTEKLIREGKLLGYTVGIAVMIYLNYSMAYISCLFVLLWTFMRILTLRCRNPQEVILRMLIATGAGVGIDAFILVPTFLEYKNSPRDMLAAETGINAGSSGINIGNILSGQFSLSYDSLGSYLEKPLIYCGIFLLIMTVLYFFNKSISVRERAAMGILFVILVASLAFDGMGMLWHVGAETTGSEYGEAVVLVLMMVICSCESLCRLRSGITAGRLVTGILLIVVVGIYVFVISSSYHDDIRIALNVGLMTAMTLLTVLICKAERRSYLLAAAILLSVIQLADMGLNGVYTYRAASIQAETAESFYEATAPAADAVAYIKGQDSGFYRTENYTPRQQNDALIHDYSGVTHYSPAALTSVRYFLQKLGFNDNGLYADYGYDNTETADSLLGIRYIMADGTRTSGIHRDYELIKDGEVNVYRNPYALPLAVGVYREMSGEGMDPFSLQEDIYGRLVGEPVEIFVPADSTYEETESSRPVRVYDVTVQKDGELYFYMSDIIGTASNIEIYNDYEFIDYYGNASCTKVLNLGYYKRGDSIKIHIIVDDEGEFGSAVFVTEDTEALKEAYNKTLSRQASVNRISASRLAMMIDSAYTVGDDISGEVGVFTTIPYQKGWKVKVAGVKVEPIEAYDAMMYIPVTDALQQAELGPNEDIRIELNYIPEGLYLGIGVSILVVIVIILMASIRKGEAGFFGDDYDEDEPESTDAEG